MRRRFKGDRTYLNWGMTAFFVIAASILFYMALSYMGVIGAKIARIVKILSPFIWGFAICYFLLPLQTNVEEKMLLPLMKKLYRKNSKKDGKKLARGVSVLLCIVIFLIILAALVYMIIPQLYESINTIVSNSGTYFANLTAWLSEVLEAYPELENYVLGFVGDVNEDLVAWIADKVMPSLGSLASSVTSGVLSVVNALYNLVIGIIVSTYLLAGHEKFAALIRKVLYSVFTVEAAEKIRAGVAFADKTMMSFISGKIYDSVIVGLICYIVCSILRIPYVLLVSTIVGVTNIIPFFGPFIGAVPSALIILMIDPMKCLAFIIFVVILQQVDGNFIGPKILGSTTGISGFWIMFAIIVGAGLFGFWGMLLGVPVFILIYTSFRNRVNRKLEKSGLPSNTEDYMNFNGIDPVSREVIHTGNRRRKRRTAEAEASAAEEIYREYTDKPEK